VFYTELASPSVQVMYINKFITNKLHLFIVQNGHSQRTQLGDMPELSIHESRREFNFSVYSDARNFITILYHNNFKIMLHNFNIANTIHFIVMMCWNSAIYRLQLTKLACLTECYGYMETSTVSRSFLAKAVEQ
jgi:hypothetical protein